MLHQLHATQDDALHASLEDGGSCWVMLHMTYDLCNRSTYVNRRECEHSWGFRVPSALLSKIPKFSKQPTNVAAYVAQIWDADATNAQVLRSTSGVY